MLSRNYLMTACSITGKSVQHVGAALKGLQLLCTWAAEPLEERMRDPQNTALAVEHAPQQTSRQVFKDPAAGGSAGKHGQRNLMPKWPDRQQATETEGCQAARHMTRYIKSQWQLAAHSVKHSRPDKVMEAYYSCMDQMCRQSEKPLNYVHISAIVHGTAKVWTAAGQRRSRWVAEGQAQHNLRKFIARMLGRLQPLLPAVGVRLAAEVLWSSAKLGLNPGVLVPGMTDSLAQQFMADMNAANGLEFSTVLVACARLQSSPCQGALFRAICGRLAVADLSAYSPQTVSNILHSLARLPAAAPSVALLDALCQRFGVLLSGHQAANGPNELPTAQNIANTMWALSKLKYAPADELAMSMVRRIVALCRMEQQLVPQDISSVLLACAELRLPVTQTETQGLASVFLDLKSQLGMRQGYTNTVWSLAVLGHLRQAQFALALDRLTVLSVSHSGMSQPSVVTDSEMRQLYQALDWLQPPSSAHVQQQSVLSSLQGKLRRLGPRPAHTSVRLYDKDKLCAALTQLQLSFKTMVCIQSYLADAVLEPQSSNAKSIILRLGCPDYMRNIPGRLTGRGLFSTHELAKQGWLVDVHREMISNTITVKQLADYLKPVLTAAAGGSLNAYRKPLQTTAIISHGSPKAAVPCQQAPLPSVVQSADSAPSTWAWGYFEAGRRLLRACLPRAP
ncbi:TPA: hypothetical protein ACH3X2_000221 [Trebouxia sp. C0005]